MITNTIAFYIIIFVALTSYMTGSNAYQAGKTLITVNGRLQIKQVIRRF